MASAAERGWSGEITHPPGCRQERFGLGCAGHGPRSPPAALSPGKPRRRAAEAAAGGDEMLWPRPGGTRDGGGLSAEGQEQKASPSERRRRVGAGPGHLGKARVQMPALPGTQRLAPRAWWVRGGDACPGGKGTARCGAEDGAEQRARLRELSGAGPRKAVNSCRVLLAGSARSLVPCSELIIR